MSRGTGKHHSPSQMVEKLRDGDAILNAGKSLSEVIQHLEISDQTHYRWRNKYGGMKSGEATRLKELELKNGRLKKLLADAALDKVMWNEIASGNW